MLPQNINKEKYAKNEGLTVMDDPVFKESIYFNIFEYGNIILNKLDATCKQACMVTQRDKYYTEFLRTIIYFNDSNGAPLSNDNIWDAIHRVIVEEEADAHNVPVHNFSQTFVTPNTQGDNENKTLKSEKRNKLDALAETLKGLTINDSGYHESDSDEKGDPAGDPKVATHTSDKKKEKWRTIVTDICKKYILSNRTLLIITTTIDPPIDNIVATSGASPLKLAMPQAKEVITNAARSNAWILCNPSHVSWTWRDITTPDDWYIDVMYPQGKSPVLIGGTTVSPACGLSGSLDVINKRQYTSPSVSRNTKCFDASVDGNLAN